MNASSRPHPPALPHGSIEKIFEDIFLVKGTVEMTMGWTTMRFSRNMTILRTPNEKDLILVNSVRLDERGLEELEALGTVRHVIRLAGFHGMDDPFYKERYDGVQIWALENTKYFQGFERDGEAYFEPDRRMNKNTNPPVGSLAVIETAEPNEGLLVLNDRSEGRIVICGDAFQNYATTDRLFNCMGRLIMKLMGFIKPYSVGPGFYGATQTDSMELEELLQKLKFDHLLPSHGDPVIGGAYKKYEPAVKGLKRHAKYM